MYANEYVNVQVRQCASMLMCKYANVQSAIQVCKYANVLVCKCASMQMCQCANLLVCKCANVQMCKCANMQMCKCASVQICKCVNEQVCKFASSSASSKSECVSLLQCEHATYGDRPCFFSHFILLFLAYGNPQNPEGPMKGQ